MVIDKETIYFEAIILHKMKEVCGALSHKDGQIDTEETSSAWNPAFNLHVHILPYFHQNRMIKFLGSLLQCI